jgi:hypothetical protein
MYLTVTVDTEEDNWGEFTRPSYTVENLGRLPRVQELFTRHGVRATYLISYPVASSVCGVKILGRFREQGLCEIGAHPHSFSTPPFEEDRTEFNSYICHLSSDLQFRKIDSLTRTIESNFGVRPTSHRSGRWGFSGETATNLIRLGYTVDTSIYPVSSWEPGPDFRTYTHEPFLYAMDSSSNARRTLLEIPATVDFLQANRQKANRVFHAIDALPLGPMLLAVLRRLRALNRVCLSPEVADMRDMIRLATRLADRGGRVINFFFHSPTLLEGCSPFARTPADVEAFIERIAGFLAFAVSAGFTPVTLSELSADDVGASSVLELTPRERATSA